MLCGKIRFPQARISESMKALKRVIEAHFAANFFGYINMHLPPVILNKIWQDATFAIRSNSGLATCSKTLVKHYCAMNLFLSKRKGKKIFLWNTVKNQIRKILEAEPFVVFRVAHKNTPFGS